MPDHQLKFYAALIRRCKSRDAFISLRLCSSSDMIESKREVAVDFDIRKKPLSCLGGYRGQEGKQLACAGIPIYFSRLWCHGRR